MSQPSVKKKQRLLLRAYNQSQRIMERLGRRRPGFVESEEPLHEAARKEVGFDDFGDKAYLEGLRVLSEAYDREARLTPFGRMIAEQQIMGILKNRLLEQRAWAENPGILESPIQRPIFILGLPRTGTTALHHLLGQDPDIQVLEYWLAASPRPRPPRGEWESDPAFKRAVSELKTMYYLDPSLKAMHLMTADGPEECRHLLGQTFTDDTFDCNATIPSYTAWYEANDMRATYAQHQRLLKLIGSPHPEHRWVLKYPVHMRNLRTVLETYPDACFVQTHRDPTRIVPSLCSLVAGWRAIYEYDPDPRAIAEAQIEIWARGMEHGMEVRRERGSSQFFDLDFREVLSNPVGAAKRIYDHFDLELGEEAERRLHSWRAENPRGKYGEHRYAIEDFGLTNQAVADRYAAYIEHFQIELEGSG
jgi:hypothetical protein